MKFCIKISISLHMPVAHEGQFGMAMGQEQNIWLASRNASGVDNMALQLVGLS